MRSLNGGGFRSSIRTPRAKEPRRRSPRMRETAPSPGWRRTWNASGPARRPIPTGAPALRCLQSPLDRRLTLGAPSGRRDRLETLDRDRLPAPLAYAVGSLFDPIERSINVGDRPADLLRK